MNRRFAFSFALVALAAGAIAFRVPQLGIRPMHCDEAVHAFKFRDVWQHHRYRYDPNEFHGPTLYYAALPVVELRAKHTFAETDPTDYRLAIAIVGGAMLLLFALFSEGLGRGATLWAALFTGLSPAFVFYSRYYIQETLLVFFTLALLGTAWRYSRTRHLGWAVAMGLSAGFMLATKETAVLTLGALAAALIPWQLRRVRANRQQRRLPRIARRRHVALAVVVALCSAAVVVSGFLTNAAAPLDYLRSYGTWTHRGGNTDLHRHPWHYYLSTLIYTNRTRDMPGESTAPAANKRPRGPVWSEGLIVGLALIGIVFGLTNRGPAPPGLHRPLVQYLALYTVLLTALYSAIPYKTPWCVLSFLQGMILLAGVGVTALLTWLRPWPLKAVALAAVGAGVAHLGWLSYQTSYRCTTDWRNPYVYAQTAPDMVNLEERVNGIAAVAEDGNDLVVKVYATDAYYWPLPWYLRRFKNVGYWMTLPNSDLAAPIVFASPDYDQALTARLGESHLMAGYYAVRPDYLLMMWVNFDLWVKYIEAQQAGKT